MLGIGDGSKVYMYIKLCFIIPGDMVPLGDLLIALYQSFEDVTLQAEKFVAAV